MRLDEFDYDLDKELIAQTPLEKRDGSRLMVLDCKEKKVEDKMFPDLLSYLEKGDTLVLNNTKVLPARLIGEKDVTKAVIELLLLKNEEGLHIDKDHFMTISPDEGSMSRAIYLANVLGVDIDMY